MILFYKLFTYLLITPCVTPCSAYSVYIWPTTENLSVLSLSPSLTLYWTNKPYLTGSGS